ncbi:hypothetical protein NQZ68_034482 [Dissostichus eleginoides]|nr:hypothetical protein NQZ68_034482 [Dissostichus eleginoides]
MAWIHGTCVGARTSMSLSTTRKRTIMHQVRWIPVIGCAWPDTRMRIGGDGEKEGASPANLREMATTSKTPGRTGDLFTINTMPIVTLNFLGCNILLLHHTPPRYTDRKTVSFKSGSTLQEIAGKEDSSSEPSVYRSLASDAPMSSSKKSGRRLRQSPEIAAASQIAECLHSDTSSFRAFAAARCVKWKLLSVRSGR